MRQAWALQHRNSSGQMGRTVSKHMVCVALQALGPQKEQTRPDGIAYALRRRKASSEFEELDEQRPRSFDFLGRYPVNSGGLSAEPEGKECRRSLDLA